jgi:NADH-quinone oxidoreductase subunit M
MLTALIVIPLLAGPLAWAAERRGPQWSRYVALGALAGDLMLCLSLWTHGAPSGSSAGSPWLAEFTAPWIPGWGIGIHLAVDGFSLLLLLLTSVLGIMAVLSSWTEIQERVGFFHFNLLWVVAGVAGVFLAVDLFLFFVLWEVMLVPMYLLINIWGHERRIDAAYKFFLFTQAGSLLLLLALIALAFLHQSQTGVLTFDYGRLLETKIESTTAASWLMLAFFIAFAVKLPAVPFHTWLPDAHTEAPTGGSVLLAGLLLKTGAYGLIRFTIPLFPEAALAFAPYAMLLGVVGILYGAVLAFAQHDLKRLVAYSSVSHMGFVLLGVFACNSWALQGAVMQMLAHGFSTGALFMIAGAVQERVHTRDMRLLGGLWAAVPILGATALFFTIASLGLPGLGNFVGEFLVLLGGFRINAGLTGVAALGLVAAAVYALALMQRTFYGPARHPTFSNGSRPADLSPLLMAAFGTMAVLQVWLGLYPQPVLRTAQPTIERLQSLTASPATVLQTRRQ